MIFVILADVLVSYNSYLWTWNGYSIFVLLYKKALAYNGSGLGKARH